MVNQMTASWCITDLHQHRRLYHNTTQEPAELKTNLLDESDRIFSRFFILMRSTSRSVDKHDSDAMLYNNDDDGEETDQMTSD